MPMHSESACFLGCRNRGANIYNGRLDMQGVFYAAWAVGNVVLSSTGGTLLLVSLL